MMTVVALGGLLINAGLSTAGSQRVANDPREAGEVLWILTVRCAVLAAVAILGRLFVLAVAPVDPVLRDYSGSGASSGPSSLSQTGRSLSPRVDSDAVWLHT